MARKLGIFLGNDLNISGDSVEWVETLYGLAIENLTDPTFAAQREVFWTSRLQTRAREILSLSLSETPKHWGWKLPETMLALSTVLSAFSRARVVHLVRHPIPSSLRRTHMTSRMDNPIGLATLTAAYTAEGKEPRSMKSEDDYFNNAMSWNFQTSTVLETLKQSRVSRIQVTYEHLCTNPAEVQAGLAGFCGIHHVSNINPPHIDPARVNGSWQSDDCARRVWQICGKTASQVGYHSAEDFSLISDFKDPLSDILSGTA